MADFGSWTPDLPDYGHDGLVTARNVYAGAFGYEPFRELSAVTADIGEPWRNGAAFDDLAGGTALVAGTDGGLDAYISGAWVNKVAGAYSGLWSFAQFGDLIIAAPDDAPLKYTMSTATGGTLGGSPPDASMVAIVRDFVFLAGDSAAPSTVTWSGVNNAESWTIGTNQCDEQLIPDGGEITGLAGGEYGLVFQQSAINVMEYVGSPVIFTRRKVSETIGCVSHGSIAQAGKMVFFLSNRGFYLWNDGELMPIGHNKVDRTFFASYTVLEMKSAITAAIEPNLNLVMWAMPDRLWIYNWAVDKWSEITISGITGVTTGRTGYISLDTLAAMYPGGNDTVPLGTDDPLFNGGDPLLLVAMDDDILYSLGGSDKLPATLRGTKLLAAEGLDAHIRNVRITGDVGDGATVHLDCSARLVDDQTRFSTSDLRTNGDMPILARGRYIQPEIATGATTDWSFIQGLEMEGTPGGRL